MRIMRYLLLLTIAALIIGCEKKPTEPDSEKRSRVTGKVILEGMPLQNAIVQLGTSGSLKVTTDENGDFAFNNVKQGEYVFSVRKDIEGGQTIQHLVTKVFTRDVESLGEIKVVSPVAINAPLEVDNSYIQLSWNRSYSSDFAEYRIYRNNSGGVGPESGKLIFSSTSASDTSFKDFSYRTGVTNYYKVYVYAPNGSLSGSNTGSLDIAEVNLLPNGDFEVSSDGTLPDQWTQRLSGQPQFKYFQVTGESVQSGGKSVKITYNAAEDQPDSVTGSWGGLSQQVLTSDWVVGKDYTLSFWVNSQIGKYLVRVVKNGDLEKPLLSYIVVNENGWKEKKINFQIDQETNYVEVWISTRPGQATDGLVKGYIDNVKIVK